MIDSLAGTAYLSCQRRQARMQRGISRMITSHSGIELPSTLEEWCDPRRMALVVYDMQVGIVRQIKNADAIVEKVGAALEAARSVGMRVAYMRHVSLPLAWMGRTQLRTAMAWQRQRDPDAVSAWFLRDAPASQIVPELAPRAEDAVFDKLTMSAFDATPLAYALRDCGLSAVALAGIALEIGIEPTARQATDHGFVAAVLADACGFGNAAAAERSLATLGFIGEAIVTDTASFVDAVSRREAPSAA
ncbi:cysteine hydrolase family protein [Mangrovibrevibacter kandeliae]|uniref:cysteine hydrolase family protein n=1 Tax=Mangrovibrevibacter kandeliae TaxID=2968473 RepID=UPI002118A1A7|nr:cysteine hydrolase [Aurantimonas sp. CSK15Z-1]MCQ8783416.1 cysteine hydrolase [Aurantimonas sp. CSK15Z-1]